MTLLDLLTVINYALVLLFGLFLSIFISGGWDSDRQRRLVFILCPCFLALQGICWLLWDVGVTEKIYPLIIHLPLVLILIFALKKKSAIALVSVSTAYLCCQIPRWVQLAVAAITRSALIGAISYTLCIVPTFYLLYRYFVRAAHNAMCHSRRSLLLFGSLPIAYYLFDYTTAVYSDILYRGGPVISELLPTALIVFYLFFLTTYQMQEQERGEALLQSSLLEAELRQAHFEMESLRAAEKQTAIYQHDMRHHLLAIDGFLSAGSPEQATEYIRSVQADIESISPKRYCENDMANLLCSAFTARAERIGVRLSVSIRLPQNISVPDTELCAILSNGLENALQAVSSLDDSRKWVAFYCEIKLGKLLIEIKNPYRGTIRMQDDLPLSFEDGHGYGCRSIRTIAEQRGGLCIFDTENSSFTLRVMIPAESAQ